MEKHMRKGTPVLKIEHMNIRFTQYDRGLHQRELPVIRDLDVEVYAGEMVAIVGSSGSGKSLLAHGVMECFPTTLPWEDRLPTAENPWIKSGWTSFGGRRS